MNQIEKTFGKPRVFLPVIHPTGQLGSLLSIHTAVACGADGVFLIDQGMDEGKVLALCKEVNKHFPTLWVGLNLLQTGGQTIAKLATLQRLKVGGIWKDRAASVDYAKVDSGWSGLTFGGVAFKGQKAVHPDDLAAETERWGALLDVVTTSGDQTGSPPSVEKIRTMHQALAAIDGAPPLALASGITVDNVSDFLPYASAYLVATGIESQFGVLDPVRTRELASKIHAKAPFASYP